MMTIGACTGCGRGVVRVIHDGVRCFKRECNGRIYTFAVPVPTETPEPVDQWRHMACERLRELATAIREKD
jgi:hypothetical protein